ncbi:hypothetical protein pb186bvf_017291 [Paramecium bursaria]
MLFFPLSYLLIMHTYFQIKGITTYDFLMRNRKPLPVKADISNINSNMVSQNLFKHKITTNNHVDWEQEEADVQENQSFHARQPMRQLEIKTSGRTQEALSSERRSCPQTKRVDNDVLSPHNKLKSLISLRDIKYYFEDNIAGVDEQSIIKVDSKQSQHTN